MNTHIIRVVVRINLCCDVNALLGAVADGHARKILEVLVRHLFNVILIARQHFYGYNNIY